MPSFAVFARSYLTSSRLLDHLTNVQKTKAEIVLQHGIEDVLGHQAWESHAKPREDRDNMASEAEPKESQEATGSYEITVWAYHKPSF